MPLPTACLLARDLHLPRHRRRAHHKAHPYYIFRALGRDTLYWKYVKTHKVPWARGRQVACGRWQNEKLREAEDTLNSEQGGEVCAAVEEKILKYGPQRRVLPAGGAGM